MLVQRSYAGEGNSENKKTQKTKFTVIALDAQALFLAGDFNDWDENAHPFKKGAEGT